MPPNWQQHQPPPNWQQQQQVPPDWQQQQPQPPNWQQQQQQNSNANWQQQQQQNSNYQYQYYNDSNQHSQNWGPNPNIWQQSTNLQDDVAHPDSYVKDNKILWRLVKQDIPLGFYPRITKDMLVEQFPQLKFFLSSASLDLFSLNDLKAKVPTAPQPIAKQTVEQRLLANNEKATELVQFEAKENKDNRSDILHPITFKHSPLISASDLMDRRRKANIKIPPINSYDLSHIGYSGRISNETWLRLHDLGCQTLRLKHFKRKEIFKQQTLRTEICQNQEDKNSVFVKTSDDSEGFDNVSQVKVALSALVECQQAVFPHNKSGKVLEHFITDKGDFQFVVYKQIQAHSQKAQAKVIEAFVDDILEDNGNRYNTNQKLHDLESLEIKFNNMIVRYNTKLLINAARAQELESKKESEEAEKRAIQKPRFNQATTQGIVSNIFLWFILVSINW